MFEDHEDGSSDHISSEEFGSSGIFVHCWWGINSLQSLKKFALQFLQSITFKRNSLACCKLTEVMLVLKASPSITNVKQLVLLC